MLRAELEKPSVAPKVSWKGCRSRWPRARRGGGVVAIPGRRRTPARCAARGAARPSRSCPGQVRSPRRAEKNLLERGYRDSLTKSHHELTDLALLFHMNRGIFMIPGQDGSGRPRSSTT